MAKPSDAEYLQRGESAGGIEHDLSSRTFFEMAGFRTADNVVYLADCLSSRETLEKYQIGFVYDVASYLDTLHRVKEMEASLCALPCRSHRTDCTPCQDEH